MPTFNASTGRYGHLKFSFSPSVVTINVIFQEATTAVFNHPALVAGAGFIGFVLLFLFLSALFVVGLKVRHNFLVRKLKKRMRERRG